MLKRSTLSQKFPKHIQKSNIWDTQGSGKISVIIPTLNEKKMLPLTLKKLEAGGHLIKEILVCDGGSIDGTVACARAYDCRVFSCEKGREKQMHQGIKNALGDWLFFVFADCYPGKTWEKTVQSFIKKPENRLMAASFFPHYDVSFKGIRLFNAYGRRRTHLGFLFFEQGLLISQKLYQKTGGFQARPMSDMLYIRSLRKQRLWTFFPSPPMIISGRDFQHYGPYRLTAVHWLIGVLCWLGLSGERCLSLYDKLLGGCKRKHPGTHVN